MSAKVQQNSKRSDESPLLGYFTAIYGLAWLLMIRFPPFLHFKTSKDVKGIKTGVGNPNISQTIILSMAYLVLLCGPFKNGEKFISQPSRRTVALFPVDTVTCRCVCCLCDGALGMTLMWRERQRGLYNRSVRMLHKQLSCEIMLLNIDAT